jgi:hypothetical protein
MPGRHQHARARLPKARWLAGAAGVAVTAVVGAALLALAPAGASTTVNSQLSLSGLASADNPLGGSVIGIHPGDSVTFKTASVPTAGLDQLGLGGLVGGLLNSLLGFQSRADFSHLPNGKANTVVGTKTAVSFTFPTAGTYNFSWSVEQLQLLGGAVPIDLNGNQLAAAGVKLNASNDYVGQIVVATNPPKGGIGLQLPSIGVHPSVPLVGQLPSIGIPGVKVTVPVTIPDLIPSKPAGGGTETTAPAGGSSSTAGTGGAIPVPAQIVPNGVTGFGGGGGYFPTLLPNSGSQSGGATSLLPISTIGNSAKAGSKQTDQKSTGKDKTIDLASSKAPTGQLSVVLAIIAIIALTLVAATYARLYVLRRPPS